MDEGGPVRSLVVDVEKDVIILDLGITGINARLPSFEVFRQWEMIRDDPDVEELVRLFRESISRLLQILPDPLDFDRPEVWGEKGGWRNYPSNYNRLAKDSHYHQWIEAVKKAGLETLIYMPRMGMVRDRWWSADKIGYYGGWRLKFEKNEKTCGELIRIRNILQAYLASDGRPRSVVSAGANVCTPQSPPETPQADRQEELLRIISKIETRLEQAGKVTVENPIAISRLGEEAIPLEKELALFEQAIKSATSGSLRASLIDQKKIVLRKLYDKQQEIRRLEKELKIAQVALENLPPLLKKKQGELIQVLTSIPAPSSIAVLTPVPTPAPALTPTPAPAPPTPIQKPPPPPPPRPTDPDAAKRLEILGALHGQLDNQPPDEQIGILIEAVVDARLDAERLRAEKARGEKFREIKQNPEQLKARIAELEALLDGKPRDHTSLAFRFELESLKALL